MSQKSPGSRKHLEGAKRDRRLASQAEFRKIKRENAGLLAEARAKRTPAQQIALLDQRLGKGVGATKERTRLASLLKKK